MKFFSKNMIKLLQFALGTLHTIFYIRYIDQSSFFFEENNQYGIYPAENFYYFYEWGFLFFLICNLFKSLKSKLKILSCTIFVLFSIPILQYIIYPSASLYVFGGDYWYAKDNFLNFDGYAIGDIVCIIIFSIVYISSLLKDSAIPNNVTLI